VEIINDSTFYGCTSLVNFNIGYDSSMKEPETGLNRDTVIQNSDYGDGDAAHRSRGGHLGIDIFAPNGEPVVAPVTGIVIKSSNQDRGAGGKFVTIDKNGISFYHAHLDQTYVEDGQEVKAGQLIGTCGNTGNAAGTHPHVHFSIFRTKEGYSRGSINPWPSLQNVMYNVTKSDKNLDVLHKKLQKLGFDLGNEQKFGINGPKTQTALIKLNKTYDQKQQTGGLTSKIALFLSSIINSDTPYAVLSIGERAMNGKLFVDTSNAFPQNWDFHIFSDTSYAVLGGTNVGIQPPTLAETGLDVDNPNFIPSTTTPDTLTYYPATAVGGLGQSALQFLQIWIISRSIIIINFNFE
jgi:biotin carboxyl carrier protein